MAKHGPTVLRVCRAVVGPLDAEDAWSETFLSALRAYVATGLAARRTFGAAEVAVRIAHDDAVSATLDETLLFPRA